VWRSGLCCWTWWLWLVVVVVVGLSGCFALLVVVQEDLICTETSHAASAAFYTTDASR
jgi:hypothetical protein